jgi:hypothetical protein
MHFIQWKKKWFFLIMKINCADKNLTEFQEYVRIVSLIYVYCNLKI